MNSNINTNKNAWLLLAIGLMALIINIDYTAVNLALIPMSFDLTAKIDTIKWVLSGYALAWAALVVPAGKTIDTYGARRVCLFGLMLFLLGSVITGFANSSTVLIIGRIIQGIAGAFYVPTLYGLISIYFPTEKRGFATGILSLGIGLGMAIGPTFGGWMVTWLSWRWIFFINIPLGIITTGIIFSLPETTVINKQHAVDKLASLFLMLMTVSFVYALDHIVTWGISSSQFLLLCVFSIAMLMLFVYRQKHLSNPFITRSLLKNKNYLGTTITFALEQYAFAALMVMIGLMLQKTMGMSALHASLFFLALTLAFAIISPISGKLIDNFGMKPFALTGMLILTLSTLLLAYMPLQLNLLLMIAILLVIGIGMGLALSALNTGVVTTVPENEIGMASSIFLMLALISNTCGIIISTLIYEWVSYQALIHDITQQLSIPLNTSQLTQLHGAVAFIGNSGYALDQFSENIQQSIISFLPGALSQGIHAALLTTAMLTFVGSCCVGFLTKSAITKKTKHNTVVA